MAPSGRRAEDARAVADAGGRVGDVLARVGLALTALVLGVVLAVVTVSTVWLMTGADDGNLTQSMSVYTLAGMDAQAWPVLLAGLAGAVLVLALCWLAATRGAFLDGPRPAWALVGVTLVAQLAVILAMQTRATFWGDSWMVDDFSRRAALEGLGAIFRGPYKTLFYDARLYFACYPFQATFFWLFYGLRLAFGDASYLVFQMLSALVTSAGAWALLDLGRSLTESRPTRRVLWVLVALCLPMYWLSTFLYGNAMGCGFALVFLAMQARAMRAGTRRGELSWAVGSVVPLALALCVKATFVLFAIGALMAWLVLALCRRSAWGLAAAVCSVLVAHAVAGLPFEALRAASGGYEFGDPLTTLNHLELGLRMGQGEFYVSVDGGDVTFAPGGWSNHANAVWSASGENGELQNAVAARELARDVLTFVDYPSYAVWFFSLKLATEWADPTYQALYYLSMCGDAWGQRVNPADLGTPVGLACTLATFLLDGYQTVTFGGAFAYVAWLARRWGRGATRRARGANASACARGANDPAGAESDASRAGVADASRADDAASGAGPAARAGAGPLRNPVALLLAAVFFTGFGCYLLWEAKAVYVLPFAIAALPLSAVGVEAVMRRIPVMRRRIR